MASGVTEPTLVGPSPVFVSDTGSRGRRLRRLGWVFGVLCSFFAAAMLSNLVGAQSRAPALLVPATADTTRPRDFVPDPAAVAADRAQRTRLARPVVHKPLAKTAKGTAARTSATPKPRSTAAGLPR